MRPLHAPLLVTLVMLAPLGCPDAVRGRALPSTSTGGGGGAADGGAGGAGGDAGAALGGSTEFDGQALTPAPGEDKAFGHAVALSDGAVPTVLIGAPYEDTNGDAAGAAYVFVLRGASWVQQQKLVPRDIVENDQAGSAVALDGDTALIGAPYRDAGALYSGAAFVFVRSGQSWVEQAELVPSEPLGGEFFGSSVALAGDVAIVGAPRDSESASHGGAVHVFVRSGTEWTDVAKLVATDASADDELGGAVALDGDTALIGARFDDEVGGDSGSAYVFVREGDQWSEQAKLLASDGANDDDFGSSVALSGNTAVVGAYQDDVNGDTSGSAYVFVRDGTAWSQDAKLLANDGVLYDWFGSAVSVLGDRILVGAPGVDGADINIGAVYLFRRRGARGAWLFDRKVVPNVVIEEQFGSALSQSGSYAAIGAPDFGMPDSGKVYMWNVP
jgi:hypothetical protein